METDKKLTFSTKFFNASVNIVDRVYIPMIRHNREFLGGYYDARKKIIDIIGFIGVITGLFLQINQYNSEPLKMVQVFMLIIFAVFLSIFLIDFWTILIAYHKDTPKNSFFFSALLSLICFGLIYNLFNFILSSFWVQILSIVNIIKPYIWLLIIFYIFNAESFFNKKFGRRKIISFITRESSILLVFLLFAPNFVKYIFHDKRLLILMIIFAVLDILQYEYKLISKKQNMFLNLLLIIAIFYSKQFIIYTGTLGYYLEKLFNLYLSFYGR